MNIVVIKNIISKNSKDFKRISIKENQKHFI